MPKTALFLVASALLGAAFVQNVNAGAGRTPAKVKYAAVQKVFDTNCIGCHGAHGRGNIDLRSYDSVMKGGNVGKIVKAGDPDHSIMVRALKSMPGVPHMPPRGPLNSADLSTIQTWIKQGARK